ncbi:hypothetical protein GE09DRAFT_8153 [Coniochaeta sp. 2T2.1]|nr:hypothetical protein GE09DRAFT_8153 [Coniochaeta sp. 2T2.1]
MLFAVFFAFWRFAEIVTLIPLLGMLSYFVDGYNKNNLLTPNYILILFIVSVLSAAWAIFTLFSYHRSSSNARFVGLIDLGFVGALIAGVYYLRFIAGANCSRIIPGDSYDVTFGIFGSAHLNGFSVSVNKTCAMLKACFALGIMNIVFFFFTAVLALLHGDDSDKKVRRERSRSHHRHRSGSRHGSHRSSHSHSRV